MVKEIHDKEKVLFSDKLYKIKDMEPIESIEIGMNPYKFCRMHETLFEFKKILWIQ